MKTFVSIVLKTNIFTQKRYKNTENMVVIVFWAFPGFFFKAQPPNWYKP